MPIYDYDCETCFSEWEEFHSYKADPVQVCPACGCKTARRVISAPLGIRTESTFAAGYGSLRDQCGSEESLRSVVQNAEKNGYKPNASDVYMPTLARFTGDPKAFFRGDVAASIRKHAEASGRGCQGRIEVKAKGMQQPPKRCRLAPHIVERIREQRIKENPELAKADQSELRANIIEKHGSKKE